LTVKRSGSFNGYGKSGSSEISIGVFKTGETLFGFKSLLAYTSPFILMDNELVTGTLLIVTAIVNV
jgi:hypothetical protein